MTDIVLQRSADWLAGAGLRPTRQRMTLASLLVGDGQDLMQVQGKDMNVRAYISKFNFAGGDQQKKVGVLSGGERNRLHLAITLKEGGNVILLDEPTNDIDVNTLRALEEAIEN